MVEYPSLLTTLFAFLLVLGPLVLVHELGHYLVGRSFGVKADVFSIGFGKEIAGWTDRRGTRWKLSALPLGGYVQFAGDMNAASVPDASMAARPAEDQAHTFHVKPLWQRSLIVAAGPKERVAVIGSFNLTVEVGGPKMGKYNLDFTRWMIEQMKNGQRDEILKTLTVPRLIEEGNSTAEFLNYVTVLGVVEDTKPTFIQHKPVKGVGMCPVVFWDMQ